MFIEIKSPTTSQTTSKKTKFTQKTTLKTIAQAERKKCDVFLLVYISIMSNRVVRVFLFEKRKLWNKVKRNVIGLNQRKSALNV